MRGGDRQNEKSNNHSALENNKARKGSGRNSDFSVEWEGKDMLSNGWAEAGAGCGCVTH